MKVMDINKLKDPQEVEKLARDISAAHIGHELVLFDNLDHQLCDFDRRSSFGSNPVKVVGASIFLCVCGSMKCRINLSEHIAEAGDVIVVLPGSIMQILDVSDDMQTASLSFATDYFEAIVDVSAEMRASPIVKLSDSDFDECINIYRMLNSRIRRCRDKSLRMIAKGYVGVACSIITNAWLNSPREVITGMSRPSDLYTRYLTKVQEDYHSHRSVRHYAEILCVTPKYLSMVVKKESGRNASDFIDELVIFEAKALLMDGSYTVQQVAEMMNFPNPSFFSRFFRKRTGLTPTAYQNENSKSFRTFPDCHNLSQMLQE